MPDTSKKGALKLVEKLSTEIKIISNGKVPEELDIYSMLYTYGEDISAAPSLSRSSIHISKECAQAKHDFLKVKNEPLSQGDIIALSDSCFFDMLCIPLRPIHLRFQKGVKRVIDVVGALIGIAFTLPLMPIISAIIKLTSPGTIFFKQERYGYQGKKFMFFKFRSMNNNSGEDTHRDYVLRLIAGANADQQPWSKLNNDHRRTLFGKFLRKSSLDELPQFFNVLKGEMSLVGPRPPIPYEVEKYQLWHYNRIMEVKPGITGLWQVEGRSTTSFNDMVRLDLSYINNWSLWLDFRIIMKTFWVVIFAKGAD
ncbi:MAG: sugar transferase [Deltaproteobacteria bacterium]|nr:sugar transferase [Deltaproteobacteria bacterium]